LSLFHFGPSGLRREIVIRAEEGARRLALGDDVVAESLSARILLVVFVERDRDVVRLISARRATQHERRRYEEGE